MLHTTPRPNELRKCRKSSPNDLATIGVIPDGRSSPGENDSLTAVVRRSACRGNRAAACGSANRWRAALGMGMASLRTRHVGNGEVFYETLNGCGDGICGAL